MKRAGYLLILLLLVTAGNARALRTNGEHPTKSSGEYALQQNEAPPAKPNREDQPETGETRPIQANREGRVKTNPGYLVKGSVRDSVSDQPEMYATLRIYAPPASGPIRLFVSDDQGRFQTTLSRPGNYILQASSVGKEVRNLPFTVSGETAELDLGVLRMQEDVKQLGEVSVFAAKPLVKAEADKTVYHLADDPDSETNTLLEMLRKVPLVSVDSEEKIRVNGTANFRIYLNGKPSNMLSNNPTEVLRGIPARTIKKVEVITDPGARYDAEGVGGILNIVTQKAELEGYNVNLNATWMNRMKAAGGFASLKYGAFSLTGNYSYDEYASKTEEEYVRRQPGTPEEENLSTYSDVRIKEPGHYAGLEGSYEIDSLNLLSVAGTLNIRKEKETYATSYRMEDRWHAPVYSYREDKTNHRKGGGGSFKTDYQHLFKHNKEEVLTLSYQYDYSPDDQNADAMRYDRKGDAPSLHYIHTWDRQINKATRHEHTAQMDYVTPLPSFFSFADAHRAESGLKYIRRSNRSEALSYTKTEATQAWEPASFQPVLDYRHIQHILAVYAGYTLQRGKWGANSGLRMEHTWQTVAYQKGEGDDFDYKETDWVPSLSVSFKATPRHQVRMGYNLRLRRPGINFLNPYRWVDGNGIHYGNPELTSEKQHRLSFTYNYFSAKLNLQATGLYTRGKNCVGNYQFVDADGILNSTYGNIEQMRGGGISTYVGYNPGPATTVSVNGLMNYLFIQAKPDATTVVAGQRNGGFCGGVYVNFSQRFRKNWRFTFGGGYGHPEPTLGTDSYHHYFYDMKLAKTFLNDRLTVGLRFLNVFSPYLTLTTHDTYADFQATATRRRFERKAGLSVSYRFGGLKNTIRKALRSIRNDDLIKNE